MFICILRLIRSKNSFLLRADEELRGYQSSYVGQRVGQIHSFGLANTILLRHDLTPPPHPHPLVKRDLYAKKQQHNKICFEGNVSRVL